MDPMNKEQRYELDQTEQEDSTEDKDAATRLLDFQLGWFAEPLVFGDYPKSMRELVKERLPTFSKDDKRMVKGAFDYLGINYYVTPYGQNMPKTPPGTLLHHDVDSLASAQVFYPLELYLSLLYSIYHHPVNRRVCTNTYGPAITKSSWLLKVLFTFNINQITEHLLRQILHTSLA
ncbi:hypothetical protein FNV43_RR27040 [Rhamnella rubrinervis]|uniref:Beta-glucosidase n=1 Tax=Rhamnella rubrinervis TaxID=2594499 RepID=A0A8K0DR21_9ROSA|nr:hypothetical protein FNV43_RR27040 [Rhamnella rubrinervis]